MSCLIQLRETARPQSFVPPAWANVYVNDDDLPHRGHGVKRQNFWWVELGGEQDSIHDTEELRDELLKAALGVWDHIKNRGDHGAENWVLDWLGFLPGKRESRRYVGDHILTQNDVRAEGRFDDLVAYGGWSMDDHHPGGIRYPGKPTIFHPAPSPFGIPYRCLYSRTVPNLLFAGRNISCSHAAMSSTRVMATCATLGQAAGTAAAIAVRRKASARGVYHDHLRELKQTLMEDDCYLPWNRRDIPALTAGATARAGAGDPEPLRNGIDRPVGDADNGWTAEPGSWAEYRFAETSKVRQLRFVFDSDLNADVFALKMRCDYPLDLQPEPLPGTLVRAFRVEALTESGEWARVARKDENCRRLVQLGVDVETKAVRLVPEATWGSETARVFAWDVR